MAADQWTIGFLTFLVLFSELCGVKITNISVPAWIQNGTADSVILDCEYQITDSDERLVVKWFLNDDPEPIYQWIPELNTRTSSKRLHGRLDVEYKITNSSKFSQHRALRILKPTTDLSGRYRCDVVSLENQDSAEGTMIIYAPPSNFKFFSTENSKDGVNITCEADGVYPLPQLRVYEVTPGEAHKKHLPGRRSHYEKNGIFNMQVTIEVFSKELPDDGPIFFECELVIQGIGYVDNTRLQYLPGAALAEVVIESTDGSCSLSGMSLLHLMATILVATLLL